ncbi:bifunctional methylenetetrahydrofolate dehydrogenase/methenyltetrahydrofolate cyclohydrolase FolD [Ectobacillus ponti]|uniref:Bifunctional protein FolD n=1 Tax=Ectobacillus ponti TaxID=2961894 RepID=A0AA41X155_9BACI|nr:bifunctional methylenetetrahydrofolate dehydrogenase/methenyltetrahydrofolate cyclohydrolase FolD [Ectobacillus ponti]MCP8967049.1 bifunctional methylenetetrahydrofolate dehydrogenase/methenyltetrahydrofolate cyclohydrolase FolD [Ectobacillus ponti]
MTAELIQGMEVAKKKRQQLKEQTTLLREQGIVPGLAVILVGDDPASRSYVKGKQRGCEETGIHSELIEFPDTITQERLLQEIDRLNEAAHIHGILVQLPLPKHIEEDAVIERISPEKDVDGFHPVSIGRMMTGQETFLPCTPHGIIELVKEKNIPIAGKHVVIIGRSNIVGKPVGQLFLQEDATVTYCHSKTQNMASLTRLADILVVAVGRPKLITAEYVKEGAAVIDVGVNRLDTGKLCGDVDFEQVQKVASYITPVPGGVGPMTITMLLHNTVASAERTKVACTR